VKGLKLIAFLAMLSLLLACLVSVPALSGENPWDADGGTDEKNPSGYSDTVDSKGGDDGVIVVFGCPTIDDPNASWFDLVLLPLSYAFSSWVLSNSPTSAVNQLQTGGQGNSMHTKVAR
jgi:hypothetical protein